MEEKKAANMSSIRIKKWKNKDNDSVHHKNEEGKKNE
jgi:hypothetical protein